VPGEPFDVVMFWKQNDTGIYGRRQDMFLKYLQRTGRVRRIVHFDNPIAPETMAKLYLRSAGSTTDQSRLILRRTLARVAHREDSPTVRHRTFVHGGQVSRLLGLRSREQYVDHVRSVLRRAGVGQGDRPLVLWAYPSNLDLPALIDALEPDMVVTDVVDDNRTWSRPGSALYGRIERNYQEVLARSDVVIANCEPVAETMGRLAPAVHVVPNGCELPSDLPTGPCPPDLAELGRPVIGYVGNLSSRLDIPLIEGIARARPQWQIVLIGSTHLDRSILRLEGLPNVHFLGVKPYDEALLYIRHLDVALIPHLDNEMTRAMNPLKAFVYGAAGVPVVSTPIANIGELASLITVAEGRDAFVDAIEQALLAGRVEPDPDLLKENSWGTRVAHVMELIDRAATDPRPT
jgi:glycosyltransferase involved in cell wall biosynthesis